MDKKERGELVSWKEERTWNHVKERERWRGKPRVEETLLKRVGIAVFCSRHALRVRLRLLPTNREINRHTAERQQTDETTDRTNERPLQTGYTLYEKKSIVNELLVFSLFLSHTRGEWAHRPPWHDTNGGWYSTKEPSRAFDALRSPSCPFRPSIVPSRSYGYHALRARSSDLFEREWDTNVRQSEVRLLFGQ